MGKEPSLDERVDELIEAIEKTQDPDYRLDHIDYDRLNKTREEMLKKYKSGKKVEKKDLQEAVNDEVADFMGMVLPIKEKKSKDKDDKSKSKYEKRDKDRAFLAKLGMNLLDRREQKELYGAVASGQQTDAYQILEGAYQKHHVSATISELLNELQNQPYDFKMKAFERIGKKLVSDKDEVDIFKIASDVESAYKARSEQIARVHEYRREAA